MPNYTVNQAPITVSDVPNPNDTNVQVVEPPEDPKVVFDKDGLQKYREAIKRGEGLGGIIPEPSNVAIRGITFDYAGGLRLKFPPKKVKETFLVYVKERLTGTILCLNEEAHSGDVRSTVHKYYGEFDFAIIAKEPFDEAKKTTLKTLLSKAKLDLPDDDLELIYESALLPSAALEDIVDGYATRFGETPVPVRKAMDLIYQFVRKRQGFRHFFSLKDKQVVIQIPGGTLGDTIGWFSYVERFQKKHNCKLTVVMQSWMSRIFETQYPEIQFIEASELENHRFYALYHIGLFPKGDTTYQPYDFRFAGNHRTAAYILGVDDTDIPPRVTLPKERKIKDPYVVIATKGTATCKLWNNPLGWYTVVSWLRTRGYRVICIDRDPVQHVISDPKEEYRDIPWYANSTVTLPWGVEDMTGHRPLQERIDVLAHADFFIGISSGLSWLAWCTKIPVVLISGFTEPYNEFKTPYRIINTLVCHGCWNNRKYEFDHRDYFWCPVHQHDREAYICSRAITAEHVIRVIETIPQFQKHMLGVTKHGSKETKSKPESK